MMPQGEITWTSGLIPMIEPEVVTEIISKIADLALIISKEGRVLGIMANPHFMPLANLEQWSGKTLSEQLTVESVPKFERRLADFLENKGAILPVELNHLASGGHQEFPMRYSFHQIGTDGAILLLGRDLRPIAEMQQQLVSAQIALEKDYETQREYDTRFRVLMASSSEITVFVSAATGLITDCNAAAATFFGMARGELVDARFAQLFDLKSDANLMKDLVDAASKQTPTAVTLADIKKRGMLEVKPTLFRSAGEQMLLCRIATSVSTVMQADELQANVSAMYQAGVDAIVFVG